MFFLILLALVAVLAAVAWNLLPADVSTPWGSGNPSGPPPGNGS